MHQEALTIDPVEQLNALIKHNRDEHKQTKQRLAELDKEYMKLRKKKDKYASA